MIKTHPTGERDSSSPFFLSSLLPCCRVPRPRLQLAGENGGLALADVVTVPAWEAHWAGWGPDSAGGCICSASGSHSSCCFSRSQDPRAQESRVEMGEGLLMVTPSDPLATFALPVPVTLCSSGLEVLVPKGGMLPPGDTTLVPLDWMLRLPPGHSGLCVPPNRWAEEEFLSWPGSLVGSWATTPRWRCGSVCLQSRDCGGLLMGAMSCGYSPGKTAAARSEQGCCGPRPFRNEGVSHPIRQKSCPMRCLLKAKGIQNGEWKKAVMNTGCNHVTS